MRRLSSPDLMRSSTLYDPLVLQTPEIDHFCSSSAWVGPAHAAFHPRREPWIWTSESAAFAMARRQDPQGRYTRLEPLEATWLLACPLVGPDPIEVVREFALRFSGAAQVAFLSGIVEGSGLYRAVLEVLGGHCRIRQGPETVRHVAGLEGGMDGFLSRRSSQFRSRLRRTWKKAVGHGIRVVDLDEGPSEQLYERILRVEARSWKGRSGVGIDHGPMLEFYRLMIRQLLPDRLRLSFLQLDGVDVAYILGGVLGDTFRGLQFSFDEALRPLALGNVAQLHMLERMCQEGIRFYDLGTDIAYKRRWGDGGRVTQTLVVIRGNL